MSFDISLTVHRTDEAPYSVDITFGTIIAAERHFKKPAPELFGSVSAEAMAWLAWEQTRRSGKAVLPFDAWLETLTDLETETPDPLDPTASP